MVLMWFLGYEKGGQPPEVEAEHYKYSENGGLNFLPHIYF